MRNARAKMLGSSAEKRSCRDSIAAASVVLTPREETVCKVSTPLVEEPHADSKSEHVQACKSSLVAVITKNGEVFTWKYG
jgi:hypothetical protein